MSVCKADIYRRAAVRIQSTYRGHKDRKKVQDIRRQQAEELYFRKKLWPPIRFLKIKPQTSETKFQMRHIMSLSNKLKRAGPAQQAHENENDIKGKVHFSNHSLKYHSIVVHLCRMCELISLPEIEFLEGF